ncbi:MAG: hypothetical protein HY360_04420 [Verrucomicrobia bacterium]|nr:hypothetical protein [Verrucomicrobiota bacterium]
MKPFRKTKGNCVLGKLQLAGFKVDVSQRVGHHLCAGLLPDAARFRDPQYARGVILDDGRRRVALCAVDYCGLGGACHDEFRRALARGARIDPRHVALHTVHQHDAPLLIDAMLLNAERWGLALADRNWWKKVLARVEKGARVSLRRFREVEQIGDASCRVTGMASNRRILDRRGKVAAMRWSVVEDARLRRRPRGLVDPFLRTVTLGGQGGRLLASLTFYATHPQSAHQRGAISADSPGEALRRVGRIFPKGHHLYFTGCAGNITLGKYSSTDPENNLRCFGARLTAAIVRNIRQARRRAVSDGSLDFWTETVKLPFRVRDVRQARAIMADSTKPLVDRAMACWRARPAVLRRGYRRARFSCLTLGGRSLVFLPGEPFVEYQLYGNSIARGCFVAFASLGDCIGYLPTAKAFREGGYEPSARVCFTTPHVEKVLKKTIRRLIGSPNGESEGG